MVFNHAKFDAKINEENSVKSENVLSSQLASWSELKREDRSTTGVPMSMTRSRMKNSEDVGW